MYLIISQGARSPNVERLVTSVLCDSSRQILVSARQVHRMWCPGEHFCGTRESQTGLLVSTCLHCNGSFLQQWDSRLDRVQFAVLLHFAGTNSAILLIFHLVTYYCEIFYFQWNVPSACIKDQV